MIPSLLLSMVLLSRDRDRESESDRPRRDAISFITAIYMYGCISMFDGDDGCRKERTSLLCVCVLCLSNQ